jgi:hypothetical protein
LAPPLPEGRAGDSGNVPVTHAVQERSCHEF